MADAGGRDGVVVEVPETEAKLEQFKGLLLLALARLPGAVRSQFGHQVEQQAQHARSSGSGGNLDRLAFHLERFARAARLTSPS